MSCGLLHRQRTREWDALNQLHNDVVRTDIVDLANVRTIESRAYARRAWLAKLKQRRGPSRPAGSKKRSSFETTAAAKKT
jgi:hypothetical protein